MDWNVGNEVVFWKWIFLIFKKLHHWYIQTQVKKLRRLNGYFLIRIWACISLLNLKISLKSICHSFLRIWNSTCNKLIEKPGYKLYRIWLCPNLKLFIASIWNSLGEFMRRDLPFKAFWIPHLFYKFNKCYNDLLAWF